MARELETLRNQREDNGLKSTMSPDTQFDSPEYTLEQSGTAVVTDFGSKEHYQLGDFIIDRDTVVGMFKIFATFLYPHFPVLNPNLSIPAIYDTAPLLFWTIIAIVASHGPLPQHSALVEYVKEPYLAQLRVEILTAPVPLQTLQAIIHLIMWPFHTPRQSHDSSWLYCGVAVNAALYMGLHHSKPPQSLRSIGVPSGSQRARASTWVGCFFASTSLGMHVGVSPHINETTELATIETFVRTYPIPQEFAYQVMVHHTLAKYTTILLENSQEVVSQSLVKLIDTELDGLKSKFLAPWSPRIEMAVLVAKLHLYTMTIIRMQMDLTSREILMKSGYSVALRIVYLSDQGLFHRSNDYPDLSPDVLQRTCPKNYFRALVFATVFLLRFFALNINASPEEQETAKNHVAIAQRFLKAGARDAKDETARAALLLEVLSRQEPMDIDHTKLRVDDRMGASLLFDAITRGHELRQIEVNVEERTPPQQNEAEADQQLPAAEVPPPLVLPEFNDYAEIPQTDVGVMNGFDIPLDFALPQDLWGDSVWGMFGTFAPQY
ncbi:hypothetical protein BU23DRAFT_470039 [Bimuria novae-zelandiae CBS 107.79]|uniref:Xylanolytic transcriptional activator regulatory domain-containing protein n=1 Tax=Bimuria novae-zelandiae CBS 107.79 TaxID=1447943 RepID=A0A6A5V3Z1_9PLEO|nr:hypothetical protein BU23DRAFT_470039 [Bimuria novae-zelandiae CBS 107.79]